MMEIKKIDILSVAKFCAFLVGGVYLAAGVVISLVVAVLGLPAIQSFDLLNLGSALLATLLVAIMASAVSFILGAILAWLYNIFAKLMGGVKIELDHVHNKLVKFENLESRDAAAKNDSPASVNSAQQAVDEIIHSHSHDRDTFV